MPQFTRLWNTIQKGSFAYNTLFLGLSPFRRPPTDLADITTLALFFGDEFIDGIVEEAGKPFIRELIKKVPGGFYLETREIDNRIILQYRFDVPALLPAGIMQRLNTKYQISYLQFYELLLNFLQLINEYLGKLPFLQAEKTASKIADACNTCFDSFLHDVNSCPIRDNIQDVAKVLRFHELKTAYMQRKLLELRCILAGNEEGMNSVQAPGWFDIMRVIQIYDDIHDCIIDDGVQDNLVLSLAYHYFPAEWEWLCEHKHALPGQAKQHLLLSLYMPCSMQHCHQLASDKIAAMNWEQQKIMHYLILRNNYVLYKSENDSCLPGRKKFLAQFYDRISSQMPHLSEHAIKSYVVDTSIHVPEIRNYLLWRVNLPTAYQLRYNLLSMSQEKKASIFDRIVK